MYGYFSGLCGFFCKLLANLSSIFSSRLRLRLMAIFFIEADIDDYLSSTGLINCALAVPMFS